MENLEKGKGKYVKKTYPAISLARPPLGPELVGVRTEKISAPVHCVHCVANKASLGDVDGLVAVLATAVWEHGVLNGKTHI